MKNIIKIELVVARNICNYSLIFVGRLLHTKLDVGSEIYHMHL